MCPRRDFLRVYGLEVRFGKTVFRVLAFSVSQGKPIPADLDPWPHRVAPAVP